MPETPVDPLEQLAVDEAENEQTSIEAPAEAETPEPEPQPAPPWAAEGFKDAESVYQSYVNLRDRFNERNDEVGDLRRRVNEFEQFAQQVAQPQPQANFLPDGTPILSQEQLVELREEDPGLYADVMVRYRMADYEARMEDMIRERLEPLQRAHVDRGARDTLDSLNAEIGDETVIKHADLIGKLIKDDRAHYAHPQHGVRRLKEAVLAAEYLAARDGGTPAQTRTTGNGQAPRDVHVEGGSGAAPAGGASASEPDLRLQAIHELLGDTPTSDEFGGIPLGTDYA